MSNIQHNKEITGVVKNYTLTALLSFILMFCLFVSLSRCHGSFHPATNHHPTSSTSEHSEQTHH